MVKDSSTVIIEGDSMFSMVIVWQVAWSSYEPNCGDNRQINAIYF